MKCGPKIYSLLKTWSFGPAQSCPALPENDKEEAGITEVLLNNYILLTLDDYPRRARVFSSGIQNFLYHYHRVAWYQLALQKQTVTERSGKPYFEKASHGVRKTSGIFFVKKVE